MESGQGGCEEDEATMLTSGGFLDRVFAIATGLNGVAVAIGFFGLAVAIGAGLA